MTEPRATPEAAQHAAPEPRHAVVQFPGAIRAAFRWGGSGQSAAVFALSEKGGELADHGLLVAEDPDRLCRAEVRVETPVGAWTARLASTIFDDPTGAFWDEHGLLIVGYGFTTYAFVARTGDLRWSHRAKTPLVTVLVSPRLPHVLAQTELETFAIRADGEVAWRLAHSDVVVDAQLVGGRLGLASFGGQSSSLDALTGRAGR
jgi:hypothetical protein